jgi:hypothetical protein
MVLHPTAIILLIADSPECKKKKKNSKYKTSLEVRGM